MNPEPATETYLPAAVALLALLAVASWLGVAGVGARNTIAAIAIAAVAVALIALIFMHLKFSKKLRWLVNSVAAMWLGTMFTLIPREYMFWGCTGVAGK